MDYIRGVLGLDYAKQKAGPGVNISQEQQSERWSDIIQSKAARIVNIFTHSKHLELKKYLHVLCCTMIKAQQFILCKKNNCLANLCCFSCGR